MSDYEYIDSLVPGGAELVVREAREKLRLTQEYRVGIRPDGRYCLACGKPLYGPELSHTPPAQPSAVDRMRVQVENFQKSVGGFDV